MSFSVIHHLLSAPGSAEQYCFLSEDSISDLELQFVAAQISGQNAAPSYAKSILTQLPTEPQAIRYRQGIMRDILNSNELREALHGFLPLGHDLNYFTEVHKERSSPFLQAIWRLGELELYVDALVYLDDAFSDISEEIHSDGLKNLALEVKKRRNTPEFSRLEQELPDLRAGLSMKKSLTLGINLDQKFRPVEAGILSINDRSVQESTLASRLFGSGNPTLESIVPLQKTPIPEDVPGYSSSNFPLSPLFQDLEIIMKSASKVLVRGLKPFISVHSAFLSEIRSEIALFLSAAEMFIRLRDHNFPVCMPEIVAKDDRLMTAKEFYNPILALRSIEQKSDTDSGWMVFNEVSVSPRQGIQVLTGPNRGGKTTYVQGVGLLQVLAQAGLPVPATSAVMSPVDAVLSHFPAKEYGESELGRLGEEAGRLSKIFSHITEHSLVLLNESLTSTSPEESEYLAEDIVRGLRLYGARAVYSTHLHGLARKADELNAHTNGTSDIVSMVSQVRKDGDTTERTFEIASGTPAGTSYAADIAKQAGIDFEQLKSRQNTKD